MAIVKRITLGEVFHKLALHFGLLLSKNCILAGFFELVFALNLPVNLKGCAHSEHNFQSTDVLAMSWRIDGHKLIAHCHRVHVVFLSQKVQ